MGTPGSGVMGGVAATPMRGRRTSIERTGSDGEQDWAPLAVGGQRKRQSLYVHVPRNIDEKGFSGRTRRKSRWAANLTETGERE